MRLGFYAKHYKKLVIIPILLMLLSLIIVVNHYVKTGDIVDKDVTLAGGVTATVYTKTSMEEVETALNSKFGKDFLVRRLAEFGTEEQIGLIIESSEVKGEDLRPAIEEILNTKLTEENFSLEETGSSLGESFYRQMLIAIILAFFLMSIVIFIAFRSPIPSLAIILAAFADMFIAVAFVNVAGIKLSTSGISAILLLIGYSVDDNVLLTTKVLKRREGTIMERVYSSMATGLTMSFTALAAITAGYFFTNSFVIKEMFVILAVGLLADIVMTYLLNTPILIWHVAKKEKVEKIE